MPATSHKVSAAAPDVPPPHVGAPSHSFSPPSSRRSKLFGALMAIAISASLLPHAALSAAATSSSVSNVGILPTTHVVPPLTLLPDVEHSRKRRAHDLPPPPTGWKWSSVLVDSGCTLHLLPHSSIYSSRLPSTVHVRTANSSTEPVDFQGPAMLHTYVRLHWRTMLRHSHPVALRPHAIFTSVCVLARACQMHGHVCPCQ